MPNETQDISAAGGIGNLAFYRMCSEFSTHGNKDYVRSKLQFISRVYSVSRGLGGQWDELAEAIVKTRKELDALIHAARVAPFLTNMPAVLKAHEELDRLTCETLVAADVPAKDRSSFASKYLHFHAPDAFPILDSFASKGLTSLTPGFRTSLENPSRYARFCERLAHYMTAEGKSAKSLRSIDTKLVKKGRALSEKSN
jgi:hypothetical protein